jgi:hypothetical protein
MTVEGPDPCATSCSSPNRVTAGHSADRLVCLVSVLVPAVLVIATAALFVGGLPNWWKYLAPEQSPMTWVQSVMLVASCLLAGLVAAQEWLHGGPLRTLLPFLLLGAGFGWLALDERFAVHERLRDNVLAPRGIRVPLLPWVGAGDFLLLGYAVAGLLVLRLVVPALRNDRRARLLFLVGVAFAAAAVAADSVDPDRFSVPVERIEQTIEEIVELAGDTLFFLALLTHQLRLVAPMRATKA